VEVNERVIPQRAYVFVEEKRFLEPVRPATVVVNNTTIINKTVNITNVKIVNKTVINEGPRTEQIEGDSGRKIEVTPAQELRRRSEAQVVTRQPKQSRPSGHDGAQPANRRQPEISVTKPVVATEPPHSEKPIVTDPAVPVSTVPRHPQEIESKPAPRQEEIRSEPERTKVDKETVAAREKASHPKPIKEQTEKERSKPAQEVAATKGQPRPTGKREQQSEIKQQRTSKQHIKPKHDIVAAEQGSTNLVNKGQKKTEAQPQTSEKN
jgi:hypothetical protein